MNIKQGKELIKNGIQNKLQYLFVSPPGQAKSEMMVQACNELNVDLMICHPVSDEPTDYKGLPKIGIDFAEFLPFGNLQKMITAEKILVVFFDDLGQSHPQVQASIMQVIQAREINSHKISDHVIFMAASNRKADKAGVSGIIEPLKSRFTAIINIEIDYEEWIQWAIQKALPIELIAFIRFRPSLLSNFKASAEMVNSACPRTVYHIAQIIQSGLPENFWHEIFVGAAGEEFTLEFMGFLDIFKTLPDVQQIPLHPDIVDVPKNTGTLYALCGVIFKMINKLNVDNCFKYLLRLPIEYQTVIISDIKTGKPGLMETRAFTEWSIKNTDLFI